MLAGLHRPELLPGIAAARGTLLSDAPCSVVFNDMGRIRSDHVYNEVPVEGV